MSSDNLTPSSAPREPGPSQAPNEEALLDALDNAADGFTESQLANRDNPEVADYWREEVALTLWLMEHLPRLLASSDRLAALEAEHARLSADERRLDWLEVGGVSVYRELMTTQKEATLRYRDATLNAGFLETLITAPTIRAAIDRAAVVTAGPGPAAASRPADGAET